MRDTLETTEILVIGGGPVGLLAVFMCGMLKLSCTLLEALPHLGGQCSALYAAKPIYDIPGFPCITAQDLVMNLQAQMQPFQPRILCSEKAMQLERMDEDWRVHTDCGRIIQARAIILCCGGGAFEPKKVPLPGIDMFEGQSVLYHMPELTTFHDQRVVIAGGGDSAIDWCVLLAPIAQHVHVVHRRREFRAQAHGLDQLASWIEQGRVTIHTPFQLHALQGTAHQLSVVQIKNFSGEVIDIAADYLLPCFGMNTHLGPLAHWGLEIENQRIKIDPTTGRTNLERIYAVGDIATYPRKLKLIMTGFAEVAQAAYHMRDTLYPHQAGLFQHSTTQGIPSEL